MKEKLLYSWKATMATGELLHGRAVGRLEAHAAKVCTGTTLCVAPVVAQISNLGKRRWLRWRQQAMLLVGELVQSTSDSVIGTPRCGPSVMTQ
jgi:hypothetical protein